MENFVSFISVTQESPDDDGQTESQMILLAENHRQVLKARKRLLSRALDPFERLEVMWLNNMRAMRDPYEEQLAYYLLLGRTRILQKESIIAKKIMEGELKYEN